MPRSSKSNNNSSSKAPPSAQSSSFNTRQAPAPAPHAPTVAHTPQSSFGIMDGIKWGVGTSIGHSIGNMFGFGTQHVKVESAPSSLSQTPQIPPSTIKSTFDQCMEISSHENKASYCYEYDKCLKSKEPINCNEKATNATFF